MNKVICSNAKCKDEIDIRTDSYLMFKFFNKGYQKKSYLCEKCVVMKMEVVKELIDDLNYIGNRKEQKMQKQLRKQFGETEITKEMLMNPIDD